MRGRRARRKAAASRLPTQHELLTEPGASLREAMLDQTVTFATLFGIATGMFSCALSLAFTQILNQDRLFWFMIASIFVGSVCLGTVAARRFLSAMDRLGTGLHGEQAVAFVLKDLERLGYSVFHDVPSLRRPAPANIDHVDIGPSGVFAIETKTIRKRGNNYTIELKDQQLCINGHPLQSDAIAQARAVADDLAHILDRFAGQQCQVQPAVAIPGWFVRADKIPWQQSVWVVSHNALVSLITSPHRSTLPNGLDKKLAGALRAHIRSVDASTS